MSHPQQPHAPSDPNAKSGIAIPKSALADIAATMGFSADDIAKVAGAIPGEDRSPSETEMRARRRLRSMNWMWRVLGWVTQIDGEPGKEGIQIAPPDGFRFRRSRRGKRE